MDLAQAFSVLKKLSDGYKKFDKMKTFAEKTKSVKADKLKLEDLQSFDNKVLQKANRLAEEKLSQLNNAERVKLSLPVFETAKYFLVAQKIAKKFGPTSGQAKRAMSDYLSLCKRKGDELNKLDIEVDEAVKNLEKIREAFKANRKYCDLLQGTFRDFIKLPMLTTAMAGKMLGISEGALAQRGTSDNIVSSCDRQIKALKAFQKLVHEERSANNLWVIFASSGALEQEGAFEKNVKAKRPKK